MRGIIALNTSTTARPAEPFESELTIELEPWATNFPPDWMSRLAASLSTIQQTIWERRPNLVVEGERRAHISLDGYAHGVPDADKHAEILLRRHTAVIGLMDGSFTVRVTSSKRP